MKSVYIHIPFCNTICTYCDFPKVYKNEIMINNYFKSLKEEIETYYNDDQINTIYIGGGTPSCLSMDQLGELEKILNLFKMNSVSEFTFECNIEDINAKLLNFLRKINVDRLSIGIQSFNDQKLKQMGRNANYKDVLDKIYLIREYGFENISLDLMYGINGENFSDLKKDLKLFMKLKPDHISAYSLIIEENTVLKNKNTKPIDDELEFKMYKYINKKLKQNKYEHYEISNYALKDKKAKHNLIYWNNFEYYGFGLGAHGYIEGFRYENTRSMNDYLNGKFRLNDNLLSKQEIMENELMLGLRLTKGINLKEFYDKYNCNLQDVFPIKPLVKSKELLYKKGNICINPKNTYLMNDILLKLF